MNIRDVALHNIGSMQARILDLNTRMFPKPLNLSCIWKGYGIDIIGVILANFLASTTRSPWHSGGSSSERLSSLRRPQIRQQKLENVPIEL
jgi:hypothetical protein